MALDYETRVLALPHAFIETSSMRADRRQVNLEAANMI
jgi:hypothetical protein